MSLSPTDGPFSRVFLSPHESGGSPNAELSVGEAYGLIAKKVPIKGLPLHFEGAPQDLAGPFQALVGHMGKELGLSPQDKVDSALQIEKIEAILRLGWERSGTPSSGGSRPVINQHEVRGNSAYFAAENYTLTEACAQIAGRDLACRFAEGCLTSGGELSNIAAPLISHLKQSLASAAELSSNLTVDPQLLVPTTIQFDSATKRVGRVSMARIVVPPTTPQDLTVLADSLGLRNLPGALAYEGGDISYWGGRHDLTIESRQKLFIAIASIAHEAAKQGALIDSKSALSAFAEGVLRGSDQR